MGDNLKQGSGHLLLGVLHSCQITVQISIQDSRCLTCSCIDCKHRVPVMCPCGQVLHMLHCPLCYLLHCPPVTVCRQVSCMVCCFVAAGNQCLQLVERDQGHYGCQANCYCDDLLWLDIAQPNALTAACVKRLHVETFLSACCFKPAVIIVRYCAG